MKWKDIMTHELRISLILASIFMAVLLTNMVDSQRITNLGESFQSVYEDRLVAKSYLSKLSSHLQRKESLLKEQAEYKSDANLELDNSIATLMKLYEETELTTEEARHLDSLKGYLIQLYSLEEQMSGKPLINNAKVLVDIAFEDQYQKISTSLEILSEIQLQEGKKLMEGSKEIVIVNEMTNDSIQTLVNKYAGTKLTSREAQKFESLRNELKRLNQLEQQFQNEMFFNKNSEAAENLKTQFTTVSANLDALADIQLREGRREIYRSDQAIATSDMLFRLEIGSLIVLGLVILFVLLYKPLDARSIG